MMSINLDEWESDTMGKYEIKILYILLTAYYRFLYIFILIFS